MLLLWTWLDVAQAAEPALTEAQVFAPHTTTFGERLTSFVGIFAMIGIAWLFSERRRDVDWRPVGWGIALQLVLGVLLAFPAVSQFFYAVVGEGVNQLLSFSEDGATFLFGTIEQHDLVVGGERRSFIGEVSPPVKTLAFWVLPTIIFFSALMSGLYHLGIMEWVVAFLAKIMVRTLGTSGAESLSAAGNIFVGQTEAPLLVRPFVGSMTRSELMAVMVGGFATVAGGVMGAYVAFLRGALPDIAGHLVMASLLSAPAALAVAKVMVPELGDPVTRGGLDLELEKPASNVMEAVAHGATDGLKLALNVGAMLVAIVGLVAMADHFVGWAPVSTCAGLPVLDLSGVGGAVPTCGEGVFLRDLDLATILGWVFAPLAFLMGVPWQDVFVVGGLLGEKVVLTEFLAYMHLGQLVNGSEVVLTERSAIIASYGLCGFANFASIGIQLGGIGGMAPERMGDLASLGLRAMFGGVLAACMTGAVAGLVL